MSEELFDLERALDRADVAALFEEFAAAFAESGVATLEGDGNRVEFEPPARATVGLELERESGADDSSDEGDDEAAGADRDPDTADDEPNGGDRPGSEGDTADDEGDLPPTLELEVELEWDEASEGPGSVRLLERDDEKVERAVADDAQTTLSSPPGTEGDDEGSESDAEDGDGREGAESQAGEESRDATTGENGADEAESAPTTEDATGDGRTSRFEVYRDRADQWRWRLVHWNGNIVADSGEGYTSRHNAERAARAVMRTAPDARVDRLD